MTEYQEEIKKALRILYDDARLERFELRREFNPKDYKWNVSTKVYEELQQMHIDYCLYDSQPMQCFGIIVDVHPLMEGIELVHSIGGYTL